MSKCGTYGGYAKHRRNGEKACVDCCDARAAYMRAYRAHGAMLPVPADLLGTLLLLAPDQLFEHARERIGSDRVERSLIAAMGDDAGAEQ